MCATRSRAHRETEQRHDAAIADGHDTGLVPGGNRQEEVGGLRAEESHGHRGHLRGTGDRDDADAAADVGDTGDPSVSPCSPRCCRSPTSSPSCAMGSSTTTARASTTSGAWTTPRRWPHSARRCRPLRRHPDRGLDSRVQPLRRHVTARQGPKPRVLPPTVVSSLEDYRSAGGLQAGSTPVPPPSERAAGPSQGRPRGLRRGLPAVAASAALTEREPVPVGIECREPDTEGIWRRLGFLERDAA